MLMIIILIALIVSIVREWFSNIIASQRIFHDRSEAIQKAVYCHVLKWQGEKNNHHLHLQKILSSHLSASKFNRQSFNFP